MNPSYTQPELSKRSGPWALEGQVVMRRDSELPERCVCTNDLAVVIRQIRLRVRTWGWLGWAIVFNVFLILLMTTASAKFHVVVYVPLGQRYLRGKTWHFFEAFAVAMAGIVAAFAGATWGIKTVEGMGLIIVGLGMAIFAMVAYFAFAKPLSCVRATRNFVFLKGACPAYLAELPQWPGEDFLLHEETFD